MAAPSGTGAAGGGAAQRSSWPGAQTAGAASTGATRAAPAPHAVVAFAPWRRQHAWNLHQRAVLVQVPLILNRLLKECCQKNLFFFVNSQINYSLAVRKTLCIAANRKPDIIKTRLIGSSNSNLPETLKITFNYSANVNCKITKPNKLGIIVQCCQCIT